MKKLGTYYDRYNMVCNYMNNAASTTARNFGQKGYKYKESLGINLSKEKIDELNRAILDKGEDRLSISVANGKVWMQDGKLVYLLETVQKSINRSRYISHILLTYHPCNNTISTMLVPECFDRRFGKITVKGYQGYIKNVCSEVFIPADIKIKGEDRCLKTTPTYRIVSDLDNGRKRKLCSIKTFELLAGGEKWQPKYLCIRNYNGHGVEVYNLIPNDSTISFARADTVASGIWGIHEWELHRDLRPCNIPLDEQNRNLVTGIEIIHDYFVSNYTRKSPSKRDERGRSYIRQKKR